MPSTPGWGDTGEGWGWACTVPDPHQPGFLMADRPLVAASSCSPVLAQCVRDSKDLSPESFGAGLGDKNN